jgi:hypothetical protein
MHNHWFNVLGMHNHWFNVLGMHNPGISMLGRHDPGISVLGRHDPGISMRGRHGHCFNVLGMHRLHSTGARVARVRCVSTHHGGGGIGVLVLYSNPAAAFAHRADHGGGGTGSMPRAIAVHCWCGTGHLCVARALVAVGRWC